MAPKNSLRNTESIAALLDGSKNEHWTRPVHRLTLDHRFKPVLTSGTFHHLHTFESTCPPCSTSAHPSACLVTVSEQIVEKHPCAEDVFIRIHPSNSRCLWTFFNNSPLHLQYENTSCEVNCKVQNKLLLSEKRKYIYIFLYICSCRGCLDSDGKPFEVFENHIFLLRLRFSRMQ